MKSSSESLPNPTPIERELRGRGFDHLIEALDRNARPAITPLREESRPLYLLASYPDMTEATGNLVVERLGEELGLELPEKKLINFLGLDQLDDGVARAIIDGRPRAHILPLAVHSDENPAWWVGALWVFFTPGNVEMLRQQVARQASLLASSADSAALPTPG